MAVTLQQILRKHFDAFQQSQPLAHYQRQAARRIIDCRTAVLGGHVASCPRGHHHRLVYHSCRHRSCPQCSALPRERWLEGWKARLLDCPHVHCIFTTPHQLLALWRYNKRQFADALFAAAVASLQELLADPRYLGARVGLLAALHTWSQTLAAHVHLHVLVTFGGWAEDGRWIAPKKSCLLPRKVLMQMFRGKLRSELLSRLGRGELVVPPDTTEARLRGLLNKLGRTVWNVKLQERYDHGAGVATYLARYLKGGPISNRRLLALRDEQVSFTYRQGSDGEGGRGRRAVLELPVNEFLSRLLEHVPPKSFQVVRGYGLYAGCKRADLNVARAACGQAPVCQPLPAVTWQELCERLGHADAGRCPVCGQELIIQGQFGRGRSPPPQVDRLVRSGAAG